MLRPYLERLPNSPDTSWALLNRRLDDAIPFQWHHHPEYELTLTLNSKGQRFIGDHVGEYEHADLVLVGPNLPHTWASRAKINEGQPHVALVFWFRQAWIDNFAANAIELTPIKNLFTEAASGLSFTPDIGHAMIPRFEAVCASQPSRRLMGVLAILLDLAEQRNLKRLASAVPQIMDSRSRIDRVLQYLHQEYTRAIRIEDLAALAALSESGLHRMFVKHTHASVSEYIMRLRIGDACSRLSSTDQPIGHIATEVGYASLANFNRQFLSLRKMTPRQYRVSFRK